MESQNKDRKTAITLVNICRVLLALVMMLSGFLKAADPVGAMYKLQEYATILSIGELTDGWLLAGAVVQSAFEFLIGLYLLVGIYRRGDTTDNSNRQRSRVGASERTRAKNCAANHCGPEGQGAEDRFGFGSDPRWFRGCRKRLQRRD